MRYLVGMDEAGYGPNLGPLVIAATVWELDDRYDSLEPEIDLYEVLQGVIDREAGNGRLAIADSKQIYNRLQGIGPLELGVLAAVRLSGTATRTVGDLAGVTSPGSDGRGKESPGGKVTVPWDEDMDEPLPSEADIGEIEATCRRLEGCCSDAGVRLCPIRARTVTPCEFNDLVRSAGNKAAALTRVTLELLASVLGECGFEDPRSPQRCRGYFAVCDKHGGRNRYQPALQERFGEWLVQVRCETRDESRYVFGPAGMPVDVRFRKGGEAFLPTALASMTAKYVRETAMRSFNRYWQTQIPGIRPTAGYPVDARRFKEEIAVRQRELGIDDHLLWRAR